MRPHWIRSHIPGTSQVFVSFTDEVARLLGLPPAHPSNTVQRSYDTDRVWMLWRATGDGATLALDRPYADPRERLVLTVEWHHPPDPETVAALVRAYEGRGRGWSRLVRLFRRR